MKYYYILLIITLCSLPQLTMSQGNGSDSIITEQERILQDQLDSLVNLWHKNGADQVQMVLDTVSLDSITPICATPDSVLIQRLSGIVSPIFFPFNNNVKAYIELYTQRRRDQVETMLGLSEYYFPIFEAALDARNLPLELKYLPIIESALNPRARSRVGASGLWQFMYYTGKMYGLEVNSYIDERLDPFKATEAAVRYLEDLYAIYGDWHLVIAAYNCGPGNVNKAIRRTGGKKDFWKIFYYLPRETRGYVPAFIAAAYVMNYYKEHSLYPKPALLPIATDTIMIYKPIHFEQVSLVLNYPVELLRDMNPQYRRDVVPSVKKPYPLRMAFDQATVFASMEDSIYRVSRSRYFPNDQLVVSPSKGELYEPVIPKDYAKLYYTVKEGDAVGLIADWYDVNVSDLRYWNNINRNMIRVGQKLVIYKPKSKVANYEHINTQSVKSGPTASVNPVQSTSKTESEDPDYIYYTVKNGDNLWDIAQKFPGVTNRDIMALNNISDARKIAIGQRLKIKKKS